MGAERARCGIACLGALQAQQQGVIKLVRVSGAVLDDLCLRFKGGASAIGLLGGDPLLAVKPDIDSDSNEDAEKAQQCRPELLQPASSPAILDELPEPQLAGIKPRTQMPLM